MTSRRSVVFIAGCIAATLHLSTTQAANATEMAEPPPDDLILKIITSADPNAAYAGLTPSEQASFAAAVPDHLDVEVVPIAIARRASAVETATKCRPDTGFASATGYGYLSGVKVYEFYLDIKYSYNCNSINSISITGATGRPLLVGWSSESITARSAVVNPPHKGRAKAQYNFKLGIGSLSVYRSNCLGINVTVNKNARGVSSDNQCGSNP